MEWYNRTEQRKNNALPWRSNKGRPLINGRHHLLLEWKDNKIQVVELLKATLETRQVVQTHNKKRNIRSFLNIFADDDSDDTYPDLDFTANRYH